MFDSTDLAEDIGEVVEALAGSRHCIIARPGQLEAKILEIATTHGKGVTNIMGRLYSEVARSTRFSSKRKHAIMDELRLRGAGVAQPTIRRF